MPRTNKPYGRGSVYPKRDRWIVAVPIGRGQRVTETHPTKESAERARKRLIRERDVGQRQPVTTRWTVGDIIEEWLRDRPALLPHSRRTYRGRIDRDIALTIGRIPLVDLTALDVRHWLTGLRDRGLSHATIAKSRTILVGALELACDLELVPRNMARNQKIPPGAPTKTVKPFSRDETRALLVAAADHRFGVAIWLAALLGLRRAEIVGLRWQDIDWETPALTIREQLINDHGILRPQPFRKGKVESLTLHLPDAVVEQLRRRRQIQGDEQLTAPVWQETGRVLTTRDGRLVWPNSIRDVVHQLCDRVGIPRRGPHAFRHTVSSELAALGVLDRVRADLLGHVNPTTTNTTYTHSSPEARRAALNALAERLGS